ncbi:MAG: hypothetical protein ACXVB0_24625 [Mucilaginibacter sp.]
MASEEEKDKGNPAQVYKDTLESESKPLINFYTEKEDEAADRALEDIAKMEKEKEINEEDDD